MSSCPPPAGLPPLSPERRRQLDEIARLEASYDAMPPEVARRVRDLAAGRATLPPPAEADSAASLDALRAASRRQWAALKRRIWALRQARAAAARDGTDFARRSVAIQRNDARWLLAEFAATRRRIAAAEAAIAALNAPAHAASRI